MKMSKHLSRVEVDGYILRTLPTDELLRSDDHIKNCRECRDAVALGSALGGRDVHAAFDAPDLDPHLRFEQLAVYVDGTIEEVDLEIAENHLHACVACGEQVRDLRKLKNDLARYAGPLNSENDASVGFWERIRQIRFPVYAGAAAAVLIAGIIFAGLFLRDPKAGPQTVAVSQPTDAESDNGPAIVSTNIPDAADSSNIVEKPKLVVSLNDGGGRIELDAAGKVTGFSDPHSERAVAGILTGKELAIDPDLRQLKQSSGQLMGEQQTGVPFALRGPVGTVVESSQPVLSWKPLQGADSYRVDIFDESFKKVASSPPIKTAEWRPGAPLRRGTIFRWQVTAIAKGEEIKSPTRPAPDAKFKVLDAAAAKRIADARLRNGGSHLLLGVLYAEAGLLKEAEREFEALAAKNPGSPIARRLLEKVRAAR